VLAKNPVDDRSARRISWRSSNGASSSARTVALEDVEGDEGR